jgi:uncharacterized membrane protein YhaH (DUF805 family)
MKFLFTLTGRVTRIQYLATGVVLVLLKFSAEAAWMYGAHGTVLDPSRYLHPSADVRYGAPPVMAGDWVLLLAWSLPFLWCAFALTARRAEDAGLPPTVSLAVCVPGLNLLLFACLCVLPSKPSRAGNGVETRSYDRAHWRDAGIGALAALLIGMSMALTSSLWEGYGAALFLGAPFVMGAICGLATNRSGQASPGFALGTAFLALIMTAGALLAFAVEGLVCLAMAAPIAMAGAVMGALAGHTLAQQRRASPSTGMLGVLALPLPLLLAADGAQGTLAQRDVVSVIEVDAPPERVWPLVVSFPTIEAEAGLLFRAGIARPLAARIDNPGPRGTRRCIFTTGEFVEPITVWDPPRRLAFGVDHQPRAMAEITPYESILASHLDGDTLRVFEGEFVLEPISETRTRIIGRTRYSLDMKPGWYWSSWGDAIIHRIHMRVLTHIKDLAER